MTTTTRWEEQPVSKIFKKDSTRPPPAPTREDPEIQEARRRLQIKELARKNRSRTLLTAGSGITDPITGNKTLLGQ